MRASNNHKFFLRTEERRFSIRKLSIGAISVLIGLTFSAYNRQTAQAATENNQPQATAIQNTDVEAKQGSTDFGNLDNNASELNKETGEKSTSVYIDNSKSNKVQPSQAGSSGSSPVSVATQANLDSRKTASAINNQKTGAAGFFDYIANDNKKSEKLREDARTAYNIVTGQPSAYQDITVKWAKNAVKLGQKDDSTSLSNLEKALDYYQEWMAYRDKYGLSHPSISLTATAIAMLSSDFQGYAKFNHPAQVEREYGPFYETEEDIAAGSDIFDPIDSWMQEKDHIDAYIKTHPEAAQYSFEKKPLTSTEWIKDYNYWNSIAGLGTIGHYASMINPDANYVGLATNNYLVEGTYRGSASMDELKFDQLGGMDFDSYKNLISLYTRKVKQENSNGTISNPRGTSSTEQNVSDSSSLSSDQVAANTAVDNAVTVAKTEVTDLDLEEQGNLEKLAASAKSEIKQATDQATINAKKDAGVLSIQKLGAKYAVEHTAAQQKIVVVLSKISERKKLAAIDHIDLIIQKSESDIDKSVAADEITKHKEEGKNQIIEYSKTTSNPEHNAERAATKKTLKDKSVAVADGINKMLYISMQTRQDYTESVADIVNKANSAIDVLSDFDDDVSESLKQIQDKALIELDKTEAISNIDNEGEKNKQSIDNLTPEEQSSLEDVVAVAKNDITKTQSKVEVDSLYQHSLLLLARLGVKNVINHAINDAETSFIAIADSDNGIDVEKAIATLEADRLAFINDVDSAKISNELQKLQDKHLKKLHQDVAIAKTPDFTADKNGAKQEVKSEAEQVKKTFSSLVYINTAAATDEIDQDELAAEKAIEAADTKAAINSIKLQMIATLNQSGAGYAIDNAAAQAEKELASLPADELQAAKEKIKQGMDTAKSNIKNAETKENIDNAKANGLVLIAKEVAIAAIDHEATKAMVAIDSTQGLSQAQIAAARQKIKADAEASKDNVSKANTLDVVKNTKSQGIAILKKDRIVEIKKDDAKLEENNNQTSKPNEHDDSVKPINSSDKNENGNTNKKIKFSEDIVKDKLKESTTENSDSRQDKVAFSNNEYAATNTVKVDNHSNPSSVRSHNNLNLESAKTILSILRKSRSESFLPQAGAKREEALGAIGLAIATAGSWLGLGINKKRKEKKNKIK